jgi:hypothetical protein
VNVWLSRDPSHAEEVGMHVRLSQIPKKEDIPQALSNYLQDAFSKGFEDIWVHVNDNAFQDNLRQLPH